MQAVLRLLTSHFVLRSKDVAALVRKRPPTPNDIRTINRSLKLLAERGLVRRKKYLDLSNDGVGYACGLTDRGVAEYGGKTFDEHSERTLDHELEISRFHIAIQELCDRHGLQLSWRQSDLKHGVDPDAYFFITDPKRDGKNTNHFFLEFERAKLGNMKDGKYSITRKLEHYYRYYNSSECEERWGFKTYRVVLVMRTTDRRDNLVSAMQSGLNHRMFWVGTKHSLVGDFHTPKGDRFSFLDL
jgi:hypothetical protein